MVSQTLEGHRPTCTSGALRSFRTPSHPLAPDTPLSHHGAPWGMPWAVGRAAATFWARAWVTAWGTSTYCRYHLHLYHHHWLLGLAALAALPPAAGLPLRLLRCPAGLGRRSCLPGSGRAWAARRCGSWTPRCACKGSRPAVSTSIFTTLTLIINPKLVNYCCANSTGGCQFHMPGQIIYTAAPPAGL